MNKMIALGALAVFIIACLSPCMTDAGDVAANDVANPTFAEISDNDRNIVVLTDRPMTRSNGFNESIIFQSTFESIGSNDIAVLDGLWIETQNQNTVYNDVKSLVDNGNPVLLVANSPEAISSDKIGYSTGYSPSADVYGVMHDTLTGAIFCYSGSDVDVSKSYNTALQWIDRYESDIVQMRASIASAPTLCAVTETTDSFGTTVAESKHTKHSIDANTALILTEYNFSADPDMESSIWDNWIAVADMEVLCEHLDSDLVSYGPTSSNSETYTVDISSGEDYEVSVSDLWSYTVRDSELDDRTRYEILDIYHDIDERGDDKLGTKTIKPGSISLATKGNNIYLYHETEYYNATFYKDSIAVSDKYASCDSSLIVSIF